ncbi:MAG: hypothetical protein DMG75_07495 [Acidobacteria bacterium]|nr:MAG: hypothetical protein DMG75_07495 [Acidobacteriota bacterium]
MATKIELLQQVWHKYDTEREHKPTSAREAVDWAVAEGLLELPKVDPYDILAGQMAQALREEYQTVNHAIRVTKGGVQHTFWAMMGYAPHEHMEIAFTQRRDQIIGDNLHLKIDVDVYNDMVKGKHPPIQLVLDYTDDVAEKQIMRIPPKKVEVA